MAKGGQTPKPGDWYCPGCNDLQFARNSACRRCGTPKEDMGALNGGAPTKPGDWYCPNCNDLQFARNTACRRCGQPKPVGGPPREFTLLRDAVHWFGGGAPSMKGGCYGGGFGPAGGYGPATTSGGYAPPMMMASSGGGSERVGDWFCPSCGDLQFAKNGMCRRCGTPRPAIGGVGMSMGGVGCGGGMEIMHHGGGGGAPRPAARAEVGRPGDWICAACGDLQFAKNISCRRCGAGKPGEGGFANFANGGGLAHAGGGQAGKPGDWICEQCGDLQFARNTSCRKCGALPPGAGMVGGAAPWRSGPPAMSGMMKGGGGGGASGGGGGGALRPGDWNCPNCGDHQFARNDACRKCGTPKPVEGEEIVYEEVQEAEPPRASKGKGKQKMKPGDWLCPNCGDLQFARNATCRMCQAEKPAEEGARERSRSR